MDKTQTVRKRIFTSASDPRSSDPLLWSKLKKNETTIGFERAFLERGEIKWYWAPAFIACWILLYWCIAIPAYHSLPKPLCIKDEAQHPDRFIAERAEINLETLCRLGPRVVGSASNEQNAVKYLMNIVQKLRAEANLMYDIETDVQLASGSYILWDMINIYQNIQNFIIKISTKGTNSTSYVVVNSHYDTVPGAVGAGDAGTMVAVMLETLRVLSKSDKPLRHPVVFLFNGAEENPLQASHAFITQHKWAKNVKALINLDSAGNGGREILFQSGPKHSWLMKLYRRAIKHPYASTVAEEMFQRNLIPSDTDFRIFRDHGRVPGLDMAHQYNGYVYHTRYDRPEIIPRGTFQNTGDNILALVREIANAPEMDNTAEYAEGNTIFFDVLGSFLIFYTETEGIILNVLVSLIAFVLCGYSFKLMAANAGVKLQKVLKRTIYTMGVQVTAVLTAAILSFLMAILMDLVRLPLTWFTNSWLVFGLYFCPFFFGFTIVPALYLHTTRNDRFPMGQKVQLLLHCHCLFLAMLTLILTTCRIRSAFVSMIAVLFYTTGLLINVLTRLHNRPISWIIPHIICGIPPFLFYAYLWHGFFVAFIPMTGRYGSSVNPDIIICAFSVGAGILTGGFMIPILNLFRKSKTLICSFLGITLLFIILATTELGFPYRPETNVQRFYVLHTRRVFHGPERHSVRHTETGYFVLPQDRRIYGVKEQVLNMSLAQSIQSQCEKEMMCGLPLYNYRWYKARTSSLWIPGPAPKLEKLAQIRLLNKNSLSSSKVRFEMELSGPDHMALFIRPTSSDTRISAWSFHHIPLRMNWKPPYFIYFSYGVNTGPLKFWLEFQGSDHTLQEPTFEIGISSHWNHQEHMLTPEFQQFLDSFPKYVAVTAWPASYETYFF